MKLFAGSASEGLAKKVAQILRMELSKAEITRFANSEIKVRIKEEIRNETCVVIQSTSNPTDTHLMELFFFCDALKRQEAKKIIAVLPYFGYARQNIQHLPGESVSANVIIRFLETIGFFKVYTIDLHDEATEGVFSIPFKNLTALPLLAMALKKDYQNQLSNIAVVSPDQGGIERARKFSLYLFNKEVELTVIEKKRNLEKIHQSQTVNLYGNVKGKIAVIVDDILTSGKTLINAASLCMARGAKKTVAVVVHPDLAINVLPLLENSVLEKIYFTDTINFNKDILSKKFKVVSVAPLIAKELEKNDF